MILTVLIKTGIPHAAMPERVPRINSVNVGTQGFTVIGHASVLLHVSSWPSIYVLLIICLVGYQRWKGCKCKAVGKQKVCRLDKFNCPCVKAGRECDPELCRNCCSAA